MALISASPNWRILCKMFHPSPIHARSTNGPGSMAHRCGIEFRPPSINCFPLSLSQSLLRCSCFDNPTLKPPQRWQGEIGLPCVCIVPPPFHNFFSISSYLSEFLACTCTLIQTAFVPSAPLFHSFVTVAPWLVGQIFRPRVLVPLTLLICSLSRIPSFLPPAPD